jgi:hypothetical protein
MVKQITTTCGDGWLQVFHANNSLLSITRFANYFDVGISFQCAMQGLPYGGDVIHK